MAPDDIISVIKTRLPVWAQDLGKAAQAFPSGRSCGLWARPRSERGLEASCKTICA